ncbi:hybrid sensor histidine kinase/response regulator [Pseudoalteromonas prydzensis]|uniref:hybrid sensor histidine kinase/response regulator n=1 Tax=Pseudoalteromonas prydzensis TaxID=182141 RepID=UPI0024BD553F|nr:hybrid sensor histidine kinase/response regulator [Pseudoalteromonas prydzensis]
MQSKFSSPVKGLLPLFIIINLAVTALVVVAYSFYPTQDTKVEQDSLSLAQLAEQLDTPLVNALTRSGQDNANKLLDLSVALNNQFDYYLYRYPTTAPAQLVFASNKPVIEANKLDQHLAEQGVIHHQLKLNDQPVGELIIKQKFNSAALLPQHSLVLAIAMAGFAVVCLFLLAMFFNVYLNTRLRKSSDILAHELESITKSNSYNTQVNENLDIGLGVVAKNINQLLLQIQNAISNNAIAQQDLQNLQSSLETEVQNRTLALEKASQRAEQASEAKTTFLATMSHEIRTPMNGVIGTIDLLRQTELNGAQHRLSTIIRESAFSLLGILDDILDFSKIEAGKLNIDTIPFSVSDTIEEVARVLSSVAKKRQLELELAIAPDIPINLIGDTVRVRQVLYNLCSNAIKFTSSNDDRIGYVRISVEVAQNTTDHFTLRFTVSDNGKGMNQAQLREIFNPFIQAEGSITREYGGTGLGLSICKSLTELMLGSINVTSNVGIGSDFVVELPFSTENTIKYAHKNTLKDHRVVLVTEHPTRKQTLNRYLSFMGAKTITVQTAEEVEQHQDTHGIIWVLDGVDAMDNINYLLRRLLYTLEDNNQQVVVLSKLDETAINHQNIFYLNAAPLCKSNFMMSLLVAAGLHTPKQVKPVKTLNNYLSVEQARDENKLVLLVEDNILNQQVLTDQLHLLGFGVEVAENGEEGLKMWKSGHYPLILTDLHMPKMSGYDMVEKIRDEASQLEDINAQPYIIAVTANALKGEKERCLNAGINDFITKPVELNTLEATLNNWNNISKQGPISAKPTKPTAPINLEMLAKYINNDEAKQLRFFKMYLEQSHTLTKEINTGVMTADNEKIISACHQLKSISQTIGAEKVAELAADFEDHCKEQDLTSDQLIELRDNLEIEYSRVAQYLKEQVRNAQEQDDTI